MSALRQRFLEDLKVSGLAPRTQEAYVHAVLQLAKHYGRSPDALSEGDVRRYFVHVRDVKGWAPSTIKRSLCGIKFFYEKTLKREWHVFELARAPHKKRLPVVLSRKEVRHILGAIRNDTYRACLTTIYACGLRVSEGASLRVGDIDSARMLVHVVQGKGACDRFIPLPRGLLDLLRRYWKTHRSPEWLFPAPSSTPDALRPVSRMALAHTLWTTRSAIGFRKRVHAHCFRHSYATHLLEAGVHLNLIQAYLGHRSSRSTEIYTHLTREVHRGAKKPIDQLMEGF